MFKKTIAVMMFALSGYAAISVHAETLNLPASTALMNGDYINSNCVVVDDVVGIAAGGFAGICDFQIPLELPVGRTIQQIEVVYGATNDATAPLININLGTLDFSTGAKAVRFPWLANLIPNGDIYTQRLMPQTKIGYPDAFVVQMNTMYQVFVHLENGAFATGLRITYL